MLLCSNALMFSYCQQEVGYYRHTTILKGLFTALRHLAQVVDSLEKYTRWTETNYKQPFYGPLIQVHPSEPVLSQRRDLLEQPLDFYEPDFFPACECECTRTAVKPSGLVSAHPVSNQQCQSTEGIEQRACWAESDSSIGHKLKSTHVCESVTC